MIKKALFFILVVGLCLALCSPVTVLAADGPQVLDTGVLVDFPARVNFSLSAASEDNITDIRLHYTVHRMSHAAVSYTHLTLPTN